MVWQSIYELGISHVSKSRHGAPGTSHEFVFNVNGQRVSIWDATTGQALQGQAYYGSMPLEFHSGGAAHFQHLDWEGTERVQTDYSGNSDGLFYSQPFGDGYGVSGSDDDPYHFAMMDKDYYGSSDSGTDHATFRQYSETQGRWMSPDPYYGSYDVNNPQSMNRYSYVLNNPLAYVDPDGTTGPCPGDGSCDDCATAECSVIYPNGYPGSDNGGPPEPGTAYTDAQQSGIYRLLGYNGIGYGVFEYIPYTTAFNFFGESGTSFDGEEEYWAWYQESQGPSYYSGQIAGGEGGSGIGVGAASAAPNNGQPRTPQQCAGVALRKNAVALSFDAAGIGAGFLPGGDLVVAGAQGAVSVASGINSAVHGDAVGASLGVLGLPASFAGASAKFFGVGAKAIPGLGTAISAFGALNDAYSTYQDYEACLAGH